jgi:hypothetical protein
MKRKRVKYFINNKIHNNSNNNSIKIVHKINNNHNKRNNYNKIQQI